jgi:hypothetical protein
LVVDDRIARTRLARSGSTFSTSAKLAINPVWFTAVAYRQATRLESALHRTLPPWRPADATSDVRSCQRAGVGGHSHPRQRAECYGRTFRLANSQPHRTHSRRSGDVRGFEPQCL